MFTFIQYLTEARAHEIIHHNSNIDAIKNIAKSSPHYDKEIRFVIDHQDKVHYANSYNFMHADITPDYHHRKITGYINYRPHDGKYTYAVYGDRKELSNHPFIKKLHDNGIKHYKMSNEDINESAAGEHVHHNITIPHLKALTASFKQVRFVIDKQGKLHAGNGERFIHPDLVPNEHTKIRGYIQYDHNTKQYKHQSYGWYSTKNMNNKYTINGLYPAKKNPKHLLLTKMEKQHQIKRTNKLDWVG